MNHVEKLLVRSDPMKYMNAFFNLHEESLKEEFLQNFRYDMRY